MSGTTTEAPRLLHAVTGRVRIHLPGWTGQGLLRLEKDLRELPGVRRVEANPVTGNVLVLFDPALTSGPAVLEAAGRARRETARLPEEEPPPLPSAITEKKAGSRRRARIAVRGLDRDPAVARRVTEHLERRRGVKVLRASPLTSRVLVEYDEHMTDIEDLLSDVADVELPDLPGEDEPAHPLDPGPLIQSIARTIGAALGMGWLVFKQLTGTQSSPGLVRRAATAAGVIGLLRGFPFFREGLRNLVGRDAADLGFGAASVVTLTFAGSPLGLAVTGAEGMILLTEVIRRRSAWRRYEERLGDAASSRPGACIRIESGERTPREGRVVEGTGTAVGADGLPVSLAPGAEVRAGMRLYGGPFVVQLEGGEAFIPQPRPAPLAPNLYTRYVHALGPLSLGYAALTGLFTFSLSRTFQALLLVNPRPAVIGMEAGNLDAAARVLRAGVTVVGTRPRRTIRRPDVLLLGSPRVLVEGVEITGVISLREGLENTQLQALAGGVAAAAGSPWGSAFPRAGNVPATEGHFDGTHAVALIEGVRYTLGPEHADTVPELAGPHQRGHHGLVLRRQHEPQPLGIVELRPRLRPGVAHLAETCKRHGIGVGILPRGNRVAARAISRRAQIPLLASEDSVANIRAKQAQGAFVALVSDSAHAAEAFAACDLAIGLSSGRSGAFPARADLLAADLYGVTAIIQAGARRNQTVRDSVVFSALSNLFGAVWGARGEVGITRASLAGYVGALGALVDGWVRLRGGERLRSAVSSLVADPHPERWGRRSLESVLGALNTSEQGLTAAEANKRRRGLPPVVSPHLLLRAVLDQLRSPVNGILAGAGLLALAVGEMVDLAVIGLTIGVNVVIGTWQERQVDEAAEALKRLGTTTARVLRDGKPALIPARDVVPGDILLLAPGDRVAADARLLEVRGLEIDEAALTGESLPVVKHIHGGTTESRIVLEGSDVVVGTGRAVVVAVGRHTRMGAMAAVLSLDAQEESPLGARLARLLQLALPLAAGGGLLVTAAGYFHGHNLVMQLTAGVSVALAVVPESLPLLAGTGQVGVARRLSRRNAYLRRLSAVEALGRVDVACADKTGTMTEGKLRVSLVAGVAREAPLPGPLPEDLRGVLLAGGLASPHPDAAGAAAHPTDLAVVRAGQEAGLADELRRPRRAEAPFDPARSFHAAVVGPRLCVKGAPEVVLPRCTRLRHGDGEEPLGPEGRNALLIRAQQLARRGLRILLVAEGRPEEPPDDPQGLTALGFLGISDPLRATVRGAVDRCRRAGVRVIMITGDHPATARAIAREAGLIDGNGAVLTGHELAELENGELDRRLERATVIARATPLDKLRIIEGLRRRGHVVAMTGDGVNDAPALRLADVGVAMGRGGTEVARQASDVVLADDDFATLVEALVEGRGFWRNMRRSLGLLLGGNLGELGLIAGAGVLGFASPLSAAQILVVNLITDALPALSVVLQPPEHRDLAALAREGLSALDASLRRDIFRRGTATAAPALAAYLLARQAGSPGQASSVAFGTVVATQLSQTLDAGWTEGNLSGSVLSAVAASAGLLVSAMTVRPLRELLGLTLPGPVGWALMGAGALAATVISRSIAITESLLTKTPRPGLPAPPKLLPRPSAVPVGLPKG